MTPNTDLELRFHWMLPKAGEVHAIHVQSTKEAARYRLEARKNPTAYSPDMEGWKLFAQEAEKAGIDGVLISFSACEPDPVTVACALGSVTTKLKYIIAFRSGLMLPPAFVQQINTLSGVIDGRLILNTVAGSSISEQQSYGDFLSHDDRYERAGEFLSVCNALWINDKEVDYKGNHYQVAKGRVLPPFVSPSRKTPEIFVSGHSKSAIKLAVEQGTCWLRVIDTPKKIAPMVKVIQSHGIEVCLRLAIICRPTREEALSVIKGILELKGDDGQKIAVQDRKDSQMFREAKNNATGIWYNDNIYAGFTPHYGPVWTTLVGTPDELVNIFMEYKKIGVTQFIISGFPEIDEVKIFGEKVLPALRQAEKEYKSS